MNVRIVLREDNMTFIRCSIFLLFVFSIQPINAASDLVQSEVTDFGKLGKITIEAREALNQPPKLVFASAESGRVLQVISIQGGAGGGPEHIRFRVMHVQGLPDPLILGVGNANGASDCFYYPVPIARVHGKFQRLLSSAPEMDTQGGFSLGPLGTKDGIGLAIWTFDWGPRESHYDHHRYRIKFYRWNQAVGKLVSGGSRLTRQLDRGVEAALGAGIDPDDVIEASTLQSWFPDYRC